MSSNWIYVWTVVWYASLVIFSLLAAIVIVKGFGDLVHLLKSLRSRSNGGSDSAEAPQ